MQEDVPIYSTPSIASSRQSHFSRRHREVEAVSMESFQIGKIYLNRHSHHSRRHREVEAVSM
jgi:hypothetical protein